MKVMILGAGGTLGSELTQLMSSLASVQCLSLTHKDVGLEDFARLEKIFEDFSPDVVINAAAYNAVDKAEDEPAQAFLINAEAVLHLARLTQAAGKILVHYSTDYVFDGTVDSYAESHAVQPLSVYGQSKWLGETAALLANPKSYVLRTAVVFGQKGSNFLTRFLESAKHKKNIDMVTDLIGCPTPAASLAEVTWRLLQERASFGLYHAVGNETCSRFEFAQDIKTLWNLDVELRPTKMDFSQIKAKRPLRVVLKNQKLAELGIRMDSWQEGLRKIKNV